MMAFQICDCQIQNAEEKNLDGMVSNQYAFVVRVRNQGIETCIIEGNISVVLYVGYISLGRK